MGRVFKKGKYWYTDYVIDGRRCREKHGKYKKLAEIHLSDLEVQVARGQLKIPTDIAIDTFFDNFISYKEVHAAPATVQQYKSVLKKFNEFRQKYRSVKKLTQISVNMLESYKLWRLKQISKYSVNMDFKILTAVFNWAIKKNYLVFNPTAEIERFRIEQKNVRFFSKAEIKLIMTRSTDHMYPAYMILLHTGIRKGELAHLEWNDIDFERRVVKITPKDGWMPKSKRAREIPINEELLQILVDQKMKVRGRYVVEKTNGRSYHRGLWLNFKRFARGLGMEDVNIHTFRHTFASYLVMAGVDLVTVKELLGHSEITTTMKYAHLAQSHKKHAVEALNPLSQVGTILAPEGRYHRISHSN